MRSTAPYNSCCHEHFATSPRARQKAKAPRRRTRGRSSCQEPAPRRRDRGGGPNPGAGFVNQVSWFLALSYSRQGSPFFQISGPFAGSEADRKSFFRRKFSSFPFPSYTAEANALPTLTNPLAISPPVFCAFFAEDGCCCCRSRARVSLPATLLPHQHTT